MCWDSEDRLWAYVPEQDNQSCTTWFSNENEFGLGHAGEVCGWEGIPHAFLARLPETVKAKYRTYINTQSP